MNNDLYNASIEDDQKTNENHPQISQITKVEQNISGDFSTSISNKKPYNRFVAFLFGNFSILTLGFCVLGPIVVSTKNVQFTVILGIFLMGLPFAAIAALIAGLVIKKGKRRGQDHILGMFIFDSLRITGLVLACMFIILIPLVIKIVKSDKWETRKTADNLDVYVKKTDDGEYEDVFGNKYYEKRD